MPFREKVKKAFGKSSEESAEANSDVSQPQPKISSRKSKKQKVEYPDNVYKPGEIPESKYKGPYNKAHQQKLHAFSFGAAFQSRRKSNQSSQSLYSPMGSRLPSRVGSFMSKRSFGPKSRQQSRVEDTLMENNEADDAVENGKPIILPISESMKLNFRVQVGMSRQHTKEEASRLWKREEVRPPIQGSQKENGVQTHNTTNAARINGADEDSMTGNSYTDGLESTFSADDLVRAMTQSTLKPSAVQA